MTLKYQDLVNERLLMKVKFLCHELNCLVAQLCLTLATPWMEARQAPLSMGFPRQ